MRTTVEITDEQRAELLRMAAKRGEKGFSLLVQEAISEYLDHHADRQALVRDALSVLGTLSEASADEMFKKVRQLRERWR
jgi:hypothetical protein